MAVPWLVACPASVARAPEEPSPVEVALFSVAHYGQPTVYSGIMQSAHGPAAIFAYGSPEMIDVWTYSAGTWRKTTTLNPGGGAVVNVRPSGTGFSVLPIAELPINMTVPVELGQTTALAVVAYMQGSWRLVPFVDGGQNVGYFVEEGSSKASGAIVSVSAAGGTSHTTVWKYDAQRAAFTSTDLSVAATPPARQGAAMAYDAATGQLVMFGGYGAQSSSSQTGELSDTWTWDGSSWHEVAASGPDGGSASMVYDAASRQLLLVQTTPNSSGNLSDTWLWSGSGWTKIAGARGPADYSDAAAYDPRLGEVVLLVEAGLPNVTRRPQTWLWDGHSWTQAQSSHVPPESVGEPLVYDPNSGEVILQGSTHMYVPGVGPNSADTWGWDGTDWSRLRPASSPPLSQGYAIAYDESAKQVWLVNTGGAWPDAECGTGLPNELKTVYTWNGSDWSTRAARKGLASRGFAALAYDSATKQLVSFGGCTPPTSPGAATTPSDETQILDGPQPSQVAIPAQPGGSGSKCDSLIDSPASVSVGIESDKITKLNKKLEEAASRLDHRKGLLVPLGSVRINEGLYLNWKPHFDPVGAKLCALGLGAAAAGALWSPPGDELGLNLTQNAGNPLQPVTYSADLASWIAAPEAPADEQLTTTWQPKLEFSGPHLSLSVGSPDIELAVAEVSLSAIKAKWTLSHHGNEILEAELGPELSISAEISRQELLKKLGDEINEEEESANPDQDAIEAAERDVSDEVAVDTAAEAEGVETGYLGATVSATEATENTTSITEAIADHLDEELIRAVGSLQEGSPALSELESDHVTTAELAPEDAALLDGAGDDAVLGGGKLLCVALTGGPEDLLGDIFCAAA
ncbi:MAG: hypothetical protein WAU77_11350 [Solirubrobacteraceae bacterium]